VRLLNWKEFPLRHCVESLMENLAFGERLTVTVLVMESAHANPEVAMSITLYVPAARYFCVVLSDEEVLPLPNLQR